MTEQLSTQKIEEKILEAMTQMHVFNTGIEELREKADKLRVELKELRRTRPNVDRPEPDPDPNPGPEKKRLFYCKDRVWTVDPSYLSVSCIVQKPPYQRLYNHPFVIPDWVRGGALLQFETSSKEDVLLEIDWNGGNYAGPPTVVHTGSRKFPDIGPLAESMYDLVFEGTIETGAYGRKYKLKKGWKWPNG